MKSQAEVLQPLILHSTEHVPLSTPFVVSITEIDMRGDWQIVDISKQHRPDQRSERYM